MQIRPVTRKTRRSNRFCGPAVLSALTGYDTEWTARLLRELSGRPRITGTPERLLLDALRVYKIRAELFCVYQDKRSRPTLAAWLKGITRDPAAIYLISAGNHWQLVQGRRFVCGLTVEVVPLKHPRVRRRARVKTVWRLS
jgi:hypothetical protein